jgi:general secretion pathway protein A
MAARSDCRRHFPRLQFDCPKPHPFRCSVTTTGTSTIYEHMFRSFGLRENPFHVSPDPRFLFSGPAYETALAELMFGIESHRGLLVLTGEAGTGKTTLIRHFLQWLKTRQFSSSYIFHAHLDPADLFEFILRDFGVEVDSGRKSDLLAALHRWLHVRQSEGDSPVIVIDEAQALSQRTLTELGLLLNLENTHGKLVQIVLAGQPELEEKLRRPELRALRQRIMVRSRLPLLSLEETGEYIASRLRGAGGSGTHTFPPETVETIYSYARGIPRIVNLLCEQALIGAYADRQTVVFPGYIRRVAAEFDLVGAPVSTNRIDRLFAAHTPAVGSHDEIPVVAEAPRVIDPPVVADSPVMAPPAATETPLSTETPAFAKAIATNEQRSPAVGLAPIDPVAPPVLENFAAASPEIPLSRPQGANSVPKPLAQGKEPFGTRQSGWRKRRSPSALQVYCREVFESFVRDCRQLFASLTPQASAFAGSVPQHAGSLRRKVIEPLGNWLRKPVNPRRAHEAASAARSSRIEKR